MGFSIRHNLTDVALDDLLELLNCHLPITLNQSKYKFLQNFPTVASGKMYFFCPDCVELIDFGNLRIMECVSCKKKFLKDSLRRNGHYFMIIPLKDQLKALLSSPLFFELFKNNSTDDFLSDVPSGAVYKRLVEMGIIKDGDITIQFNLDGVQLFRSSKVSMCPIQATINELPYRLRKQNVLLTGLWASTEKPDLNLYLKPFVDELNDLHENGVECLPPGFENPITVKVHTLLAPVDSVERCALQNIHQYNGECGCTYCLHPGETVEVGKGHSRVYCGKPGKKRTAKQHEADAKAAEEQGTVINGVKGISMLLLIPIFNIIKSLPPDYLHSVLLGVVKLFIWLWIDPSNSNKEWYIGTFWAAIDEKLLKILPPSEITRVPQSIKKFGQWKGSEFRNFLLYYSLPVLKDFLPSKFYKHWSLLVYAIHILNKDKINAEELKMAIKALEKFVAGVLEHYGKEYMKYNVHLLLHIPDAVKSFGCLWAWSTFPYENYNSTLRSMIHSSQSLLQQICKSYLRLLSFRDRETFTKPNCDPASLTLYLNMMKNYRLKTGKKTISDDKLIVYGHPVNKSLTNNLIQKIAIEALLKEEIIDETLEYEKFMYKNVVYHTDEASKVFKRKNSIVFVKNLELFINIISLVCVKTVNGFNKFIVIGKTYEVIRNNELARSYEFSSSSYSVGVVQSDNIVAILPEHISWKCTLTPYDDEISYIFKLVNRIETD